MSFLWIEYHERSTESLEWGPDTTGSFQFLLLMIGADRGLLGARRQRKTREGSARDSSTYSELPLDTRIFGGIKSTHHGNK
jgi:hypothetical protein